MTEPEIRKFVEDLARLGTIHDFRMHLRYAKTLEELGTPEEVKKLFRSVGSSAEITARQDWIDEFRNERKYRDKAMLTIKSIALWVSVVVAGWAAFRLFLSEFFRGF